MRDDPISGPVGDRDELEWWDGIASEPEAGDKQDPELECKTHGHAASGMPLRVA